MGLPDRNIDLSASPVSLALFPTCLNAVINRTLELANVFEPACVSDSKNCGRYGYDVCG